VLICYRNSSKYRIEEPYYIFITAAPSGQRRLSNPSSLQLAKVAKTGPGQADYIANNIFHLRKNIVMIAVVSWLAKCYLSNRLSANL
jgi:hypothetical protein